MMNLLALAGAIYMLQVYDRVLTNHSIPTLVALSTLIFGVYIAFGVLDVLRSQMLLRIGLRIDRHVMPLAHQRLLSSRGRGQASEDGLQLVKDVDLVRSFLGSAAALAVVDLAWVPLYLLFLWLISPELAWLTLGGIGCLFLVATLIGHIIRRREASSTQLARERMGLVDAQLRNADPLFAMGLASAATHRFHTAHTSLVEAQARLADASGGLGAALRVLRLILQSAIVGLGAYLVIKQQMTAGAIIAASVAAGRALAPIDTAIASWSALRAAMQSLRRLVSLTRATSRSKTRHVASRRIETIVMRNVSIAYPGAPEPALINVGIDLKAGQSLLVVGKSASGKSTLLGAAAGLLPLERGVVLLDGVRHVALIGDSGAASVGYLPQEPALHSGTIADNIALMRADPRSGDVQRAARLVGLHELFASLPEGYETPIEQVESALTPGMRQRLAIARAFYGDPSLIVLDEPCTNLDIDGEACLIQAIRGAQARGAVVIAAATRTTLLAAVSHIAVLDQGRLTGFGPKTKVLTEMRDRRERTPIATQTANENRGVNGP
jgi:ATP-binding cassette subfamily C protein